MLFEAIDGRSYPVSRIMCVDRQRENKVTVQLTPGDEFVEVYAHRIEELNRRPASTFPAQPNTYVVSLDSDDDGGNVWKTMVLGWCVTVDGQTLPITVDGINDGVPHDLFVQTPDDKVKELGDGRFWENLGEWVASQRQGRDAA